MKDASTQTETDMKSAPGETPEVPVPAPPQPRMCPIAGCDPNKGANAVLIVQGMSLTTQRIKRS